MKASRDARWRKNRSYFWCGDSRKPSKNRARSLEKRDSSKVSPNYSRMSQISARPQGRPSTSSVSVASGSDIFLVPRIRETLNIATKTASRPRIRIYLAWHLANKARYRQGCAPPRSRNSRERIREPADCNVPQPPAAFYPRSTDHPTLLSLNNSEAEASYRGLYAGTTVVRGAFARSRLRSVAPAIIPPRPEQFRPVSFPAGTPFDTGDTAPRIFLDGERNNRRQNRAPLNGTSR